MIKKGTNYTLKKIKKERKKRDGVKLVRDVLTLKVSCCWCEIDSVSSSTDSFGSTTNKKKIMVQKKIKNDLDLISSG